MHISIVSVSGSKYDLVLCLVSSLRSSELLHPTFLFRRRRRDGTAGATVAPLALTSNVMAGLVDLSGAPGLVLRQVGGDPGALGVDHTIEPEGEDARLVRRGSTET